MSDGFRRVVRTLRLQRESRPIAALFVATGGAYFGLPHIDPWDEPRDARLYAGPHPVVAHPPCERWGRYWSGGPSAKTKRKLGDDGGCFAAALAAVRRWGGVLEHPEGSHAFRAFKLKLPKWREGWVNADDGSGWVCCVAQGNYGHRARKLTWLYAVGMRLPDLDWSIPAPRSRLDYGFHSAEERAAKRTTVAPVVNASRLHATENLATPIPFRDVLIAMARSVSEKEKASSVRPKDASVESGHEDQRQRRTTTRTQSTTKVKGGACQ